MAIHSLFARLVAGERIWPAEWALRLAGMALLVGIWPAVLRLHALRLTPPAHQSTPQEFLIATLAVVAFGVGLALTWQGPALLVRQLPPRRADRVPE